MRTCSLNVRNYTSISDRQISDIILVRKDVLIHSVKLCASTRSCCFFELDLWRFWVFLIFVSLIVRVCPSLLFNQVFSQTHIDQGGWAKFTVWAACLSGTNRALCRCFSVPYQPVCFKFPFKVGQKKINVFDTVRSIWLLIWAAEVPKLGIFGLFGKLRSVTLILNKVLRVCADLIIWID